MASAFEGTQISLWRWQILQCHDLVPRWALEKHWHHDRSHHDRVHSFADTTERPVTLEHWLLLAVLIARIYEVFPLVCPICGGPMRIIAFITYSADIRQILEHIGAETEPPRITPARGPPLWDGCDAQMGDGVELAPDWDEAAQLTPDFEVDQRISW